MISRFASYLRCVLRRGICFRLSSGCRKQVPYSWDPHPEHAFVETCPGHLHCLACDVVYWRWDIPA